MSRMHLAGLLSKSVSPHLLTATKLLSNIFRKTIVGFAVHFKKPSFCLQLYANSVC